MEHFAEHLVKLRKEKGYTQSQLADKIGVSNKSVSRWESQDGYPDITTLVPLADALGVSVDSLLRDGNSFKDIEKKDIERYLPFIVSICGFISYYILQKLGVSLVACIIGYVATIYASHYLLHQHTDRKQEKKLAKVNALFNFLVIQGLFYKGILVLQLANSFWNLFPSGIDVSTFDGIGSEVGISFIISVILAVGMTYIIYNCSEGTARKKADKQDQNTPSS